MAKILLYDIETSPNIGAFFELYREGNIVWTERHWHLLSFAWKWLGGKKTQCLALPDFKNYRKDMDNDKELVDELWALLDEADIIIAHNGSAFDTKKTTARFLVHGLKPPKPYKEIDTKLIAKKFFRFDSNKLDDLGDYLKVGRKMPHIGMELWKGCMRGDKKCWAMMKRYNSQDVDLLEKIYLKMRPYIVGHPNLSLLDNKIVACPNCGSKNVVKNGYAHLQSGRMQRFFCNDCGAWSRRPIPNDESNPRYLR